MGADIYTDLRVINMVCHEKIATEQQVGKESWIALGHFDQITVVPMEDSPKNSDEGVNLTLIKQYNDAISLSEDVSYRRPQYILQEYTDSRQVKNFWELQSAFMLITRVHSGGTLGQAEFESAIGEHLRSAASEFAVKPYGEFPPGGGEISGRDIYYLSYRTLELSDVILIAKSNSAADLMYLVGQLCYLPYVGDTYSYFCINSLEIKGTRCLASRTDEIPVIMTRFSVKDAGASHAFVKRFETQWDKSKSEPILITGTEDLMLIVRQASSVTLCELIRVLHEIADEEECHGAFNDMITRLSVHENKLTPPEGKVRIQKDTAIHGEYTKLEQRYRRICRRWFNACGITDGQSDGMPDWLRPIREYIKSMRTISDDCILRQTCYTVLDGTRSLVRLSEEILELEKNNAGASNVSRHEQIAKTNLLQIVFAGVSDLIEHMIRMEGELVHYPETRPLLYDIPANLLELYLCFSHQCLKYYQDRERSGALNRYRLLAVPCLCSTIKVKNTFFDSNAPEELLYIEIPLHLLYVPKYAICSLVHEVAHFGGEHTRCRGDRFHAFSYCVAFYVAAELHMAESDEIINRIASWIENRILNEETRRFMYKLERALIQTVDELLVAEDFLFELSMLYLGQSVVDGEERTCRTEIGKEEVSFIHCVIGELRYLFKEAYADLSMVQLLGLHTDDYVEMLKRELKDNGQVTYASAVERAAFVIYALYAEGEREELGPSGEGKFERCIREYLKWLTSEDVSHTPIGKHYHYFEAACMVCFYLRKCLRRMKGLDAYPENSEQAERIRSNFAKFAVQSRFASDFFYEELEQYRETLLL